MSVRKAYITEVKNASGAYVDRGITLDMKKGSTISRLGAVGGGIVDYASQYVEELKA